jgi:hypothetical protein
MIPQRTEAPVMRSRHLKSRPWPIRILALIFILAPVVSAGQTIISWDMPISYYLRLLFREPIWTIAETLLLLPVAGISIYVMRRWSYYVFLGVIGLLFVRNYQIWSQSPNSFPLGVLLLGYALNLALVAYFLTPAVRASYFDPRVRWWESAPRYLIGVAGELEIDGESVRQVEVMDLSKGGCRIGSAIALDHEKGAWIKFHFRDWKMRLPVKIVYERKTERFEYGMQFQPAAGSFYRSLKAVLGALKAQRVPVTREPPPIWGDFKSWCGEIARSVAALVGRQ